MVELPQTLDERREKRREKRRERERGRERERVTSPAPNSEGGFLQGQGLYSFSKVQSERTSRGFSEAEDK